MSVWKRSVILAGVFLCQAAAQPAAAQELSWMAILKGSATTSSQLFPNPNSPDEAARAQSYELSTAFGYGGELRYFIPDSHVALGLSVEYLQAKIDLPISTQNTGIDIPVSDGYTVVPVELTGYFIIPFSGPTFGVYMGGGAGIYPGWRQYTVGTVSSTSGSLSPGAGIHVLAGVSYRPLPRVTLLGEMKFRDLQFQASNSFQSTRVLYQGVSVPVSTTNDASIHTDGVIFQLGVGLSF